MNEPFPYIPLQMEHGGLTGAVRLPLPEGYALRLYVAGDCAHWARITAAAGEFACETAALDHFRREFGGYDDALARRCLFLLDVAGYPVGTAMGWFFADESETGRLHWVSIVPEHQGRGLSKPLVADAMAVMADLGHRTARLTTQPKSWKGIKAYLDLGWKPYDNGHAEYLTGWRLVEERITPPPSSGS